LLRGHWCSRLLVFIDEGAESRLRKLRIIKILVTANIK